MMIDWTAIWTVLGGVAVIATIIGGAVALVDLIMRWRDEKKSVSPVHNFVEKGSEWLLERKMSHIDLLKRLIAIDVASIEHLDFNDPAEGTAAQWAPVFEYSEDTWRLIIYNGTLIAAYWQAVSLKASAAQRLLRGTLKDSRINQRDVRKIDEPGDHSIYFIYLGRHPDFEREFSDLLFQKLMQSVANFCAKIDREGVSIKEVFANGQTTHGIALCRRMKMTKIGEIDQGGPLYYAPYKQLNWQFLQSYQTLN